MYTNTHGTPTCMNKETLFYIPKIPSAASTLLKPWHLGTSHLLLTPATNARGTTTHFHVPCLFFLLLFQRHHHALLQPPRQFRLRTPRHSRNLYTPDALEKAQDAIVTAAKLALPGVNLQVLCAAKGTRGLGLCKLGIGVEADVQVPAADFGNG